VSLRLDAVKVRGGPESAGVSLAGVSLSVVKVLLENVEPCRPASQTPGHPLLTLAALSLSHCSATHTLEVCMYVCMYVCMHVCRRQDPPPSTLHLHLPPLLVKPHLVHCTGPHTDPAVALLLSGKCIEKCQLSVALDFIPQKPNCRIHHNIMSRAKVSPY